MPVRTNEQKRENDLSFDYDGIYSFADPSGDNVDIDFNKSKSVNSISVGTIK